jgi:hypothetical protein
MSKMYKIIMKRMYEDKAVFYPPIDAMEVQKMAVGLVKAGCPKIPHDFAQFLTLSNGLSWNGLTIFATVEVKSEEVVEKHHPGIMQTYQVFLQNPLLKDKLVLGYSTEELIAWSGKEHDYQIISRYDYRVLLKLPRFVDILFYYASVHLGLALEDDEVDA